jgi:hypothetical protein
MGCCVRGIEDWANIKWNASEKEVQFPVKIDIESNLIIFDEFQTKDGNFDEDFSLNSQIKHPHFTR